jgi:hypothetical protein
MSSAIRLRCAISYELSGPELVEGVRSSKVFELIQENYVEQAS